MRFTIVTPAFNSELHIVETIESVLSQKGDFEIEYILADGGSSDTTVSIFKDYQSRVERGEYPIQCNRIHMRSFSEKDRGMYDAIDKGLKLGTGELQAWINSDDYYLPGAFEMVAKIFNSFPDVAWLSGITEVIAADGSVSAPRRPLYTQTWLARGLYGTVAPFVLQDSVFWRSDLYQTAGPLPVTCRYAGDYGLWVSFAQTAQLWSFPVAVSRFRIRPGQLSASMTEYHAEAALLSHRSGILPQAVKLFFWLRNHTPPPLQSFWEYVYSFLFPGHMRHYIYIDETGTPHKTTTNSLYLPYESSNQS